MTTTRPRSAAPRRLRKVVPVLVMLVLGQLAAAIGILLLAAPVAVPLAALALLCAPAPAVVAAATLRPRAPGGVTGADLLTLLRHLAGGALAAAAVLALGEALTVRSWPLAVLIAAALATDALDGPLARRTGTAGPVGARIDMEADAALILVLSVLAATVVGPWALAIGLMRYAYVAASAVRPALRRELGFSQLRRVVGGFQGIALLTAVVPVISSGVAAGIVATALAALIVSFGRDVLALERTETAERQASSCR
ncbi:MAG: CDP-alcohol phosphatidyltransferase family protein [Brachybacterium sp.]|uniref:CDP-alcohol phosphatidyltransferase family protein n=1 Tax=Brachybacterium sp. TaxID=1891286 RepID=UPI0026519951|nr:CDP-alcohol phosphatidyltransferase family protein [Brachybacterium sp.]MDN6329752.1 CDP-alcohol phosphatidyltransferase family protein [Brachybacterium sp.]